MPPLKTYASERPGQPAMLDEIPMATQMGVKCPGCGLIVEAWRLVDLRDAPAAAQAVLRAAGSKVAGYDNAAPFFRCDGCLAHYERNGVETPDASAPGGKRAFREDLLFEWAGASAELIDRARDALDLRDARRASKHQNGVFREDEFQAENAGLAARIAARGKYQERSKG